MNFVKCTCSDPQCKIEIDKFEKGLMLYDKNGEMNLMYLTPNTIVDFIRMLREILDSMAKGEGE